MSNPKISVVIPTYNRDKTICRAVDSVLIQTFQNFEIIVVDDNSPIKDKTGEILKKYKDDRIRFFKHKVNKGGGGARNTGIHYARGDYVAFLDSDDEWVSEKLEKQLNHIEKLEKDGVENVVVYCQLFQKGSDYSWIKPKLSKGDNESVGDYIFCNDGYMQTSTIMLSKKLAEKAKFPEIKRHQDYGFCLRLETEGASFNFIEEPLSIFHQDPCDKARTSSNKDWEYSLNWISKNRNFLTDKAYRFYLVYFLLPKIVRSGSLNKVPMIYKGSRMYRQSTYVLIKNIIRRITPSKILTFSRRFR